MLNIVGGLDRYTSGDLIIKGTSTKDYKDRDWDTYRNHAVGFVFQSYNLIPHQTVLGNVELALTIAGLGKKERVERAKAALDKVGLSDQYYKRPNQLSGGQMQRVAIARALVNDPEILLADEPTGALDTVTSKQIMELLREVAKERLVIMVTHNPELADKYSTRIIKLLDGNLLSDSNPFDSQVVKKTKKEKTQATESAEVPTTPRKRAKMSFITAFKLSAQNLLSKRKRSIMVTVAGSIGIIGVALVLAFSFGIQGFITNMQRDMLSGNPIQIQQTTFDINALMRGMSTNEKMQITFKDGFANIDSTVERLMERRNTMNNIMVENTIIEEYVKFLNDMPSDFLAALHYDYGLNVANSIYTEYRDHDETSKKHERTISLSAMRSIFGQLLKDAELEEYASIVNMVGQSFAQLPKDADDYILSQYNLADGKIATAKNEVMIVLGEDRMVSDLLLAQLGYYSQQEFMNIVYDIIDDNDAKIDKTIASRDGKISYNELTGKTFTWYANEHIFTQSGQDINDFPPPYFTPPGSSTPVTAYRPFDYQHDAEYITGSGLELKVVGILEPKKNMSFGMLNNGFFYTTELAEHIIDTNKTSAIVQHLAEWENPCENTSHPIFKDQIAHTLFQYTFEYTFESDPLDKSETVQTFLASAGTGMMGMFMGLMSSGPTVQSLGGAVYQSGLPVPYLISIYPTSLEIKKKVLDYLDRWNAPEDIYLSNGTLLIKYVLGEDAEGNPIHREKITYTDTLSVIFRMISQMVNLITIALVSFTSLALVVSSVMIGIITYVSVVERIKEIGVIRSLGGRKRDVANLFTAETFILGFSSGVFGIAVTYIVAGLVSWGVKAASGIANIAVLPFGTAAIMITLSVTLTLISGLMPSRSAAKKDPVVALRTE
jgi:putative ABC transport system permease protein